MAGQRVRKESLLSSFVEQRIEDKRFLAAFGGGRRGIHVRVEQRVARLVCGPCLGLVHRRRGGLGAGVRRQVERTLAAAAAKRKRGHAQDNDGPSRSCRAQLTDHDDIPKSGRTIQRLPCHGESNTTMKLQRNSFATPYFRCFSRRFAHAFACASTFFGAVPPKLVRLFTDASTDNAFSASGVIFGSTSCIAFSGSS